MNWTANTGTRPSSLKNSDVIHVRLRNGSERGPWKVQTNWQYKTGWGLDGGEYNSVEWRKA